ncbi:MAG: hypothetical protein GY778_07255 [bacterium]|nr:hypothetical protein [bacterium]
MPQAARQFDTTAHGGAITLGTASSVYINCIFAAMLGTDHVCPMTTGTVPHKGGPVTTSSSNVYIERLLAARMGDSLTCTGPPDTITTGSPNVFIGG